MPATIDAHVLIMAKAPVPGAVKTRLMPTFSAEEAAGIAAASLHDTLDAVRSCGASRRRVALAGEQEAWVVDGFDVEAQRGDTFNQRLEHAWDAAGGPGLQIGMDTPQVSAALLDNCLASLADSDAVVGLADDGGWWAIGFRRWVRGAFDTVPMSQNDTGARQVARLQALGLRVAMLPQLRDIDLPEDLDAVTMAFPDLRVSRLVRRLREGAA